MCYLPQYAHHRRNFQPTIVSNRLPGVLSPGTQKIPFDHGGSSMSFLRSMSLMQRVLLLFGVAILAVGFASAQSLSNPNSSAPSFSAANESSSSAFEFDADGDPGGSAASPSASAASGEGAGAGAGSIGHSLKSLASHSFALELGAGFNGPIGNDTSTSSIGGVPYGPFITWGGNFTIGGGLHFSKRFTLLGEFQFMDNKLPGALINDVGSQTGDTHIISLTAAPVIDLFPKRINSIYVTGGGGYYHKSTNFNVLECCDLYGEEVPVSVDSFSSNQVGGSLGFGLTHRLGGVYGDGKTKLFAEARYLYIHTPPLTATNGLGTTELIPVTLGVRF
jgi:hypothetical protein